jgi:hypothetical protein
MRKREEEKGRRKEGQGMDFPLLPTPFSLLPREVC